MTGSTRDDRSRRVAFVPFCLFCRAFQAEGLVKDGASHDGPVVKELLARDINLVQMPCPEAEFEGVDRQPHGYDWYDRPEFRELCGRLADGVAARIKDLVTSGYEVCAVLGIEYSPSCAVKNQYMGRRGTVKQEGWFMAALRERLVDAGLRVPLIGINRRGLKSTAERLAELLDGVESGREKKRLKTQDTRPKSHPN